MLRQRIYIPRYDWTVVVFYDADKWDADRILGEIYDLGIDEDTIRQAASNLYDGIKDTGLTYTNARERTTIIVLSRTSSKAEFANSWVHEIGHCSKHIALAYGLDCNGEEVNYLSGELARSMQPIAARLMCPTCND